ncbi:MAG: fatty acid desaturase, partial [Pseudomonadota bacterium]
MGRIAKVSGRSLFGASRWAMLCSRSRWRGIGMVMHAWLVIGAAAALAIAFPYPAVVVAAAVVIGSRQLGLAIR